MPRTTPVRDVMTTDVLAFRPEDPIQEALERLTARPPQPITLEVVRQQAADLGARVVERADDRIEIYLPSTERRIHEERHDFRSLETAGAFLSGIAVRKAQFG